MLKNIAERKIIPVEVNISGKIYQIRISRKIGYEIIKNRPEYEDVCKISMRPEFLL